MIHLLVIILLVVGQPKNVESDCNSSCATTTYRLSSVLEPNCTNDCPYESKISVFGNDNFDEQLNLTLIGHNVENSEILTLALQINVGSITNYYICFKFGSGKSAAVLTRFGLIKPIGLSFYSENEKLLHCSWNMTWSQLDVWPLNGTKMLDLAKDPNYNISLSVNLTITTVETNPMRLPIYARQYIACCGYTIFKNNEYSLAIRQNDNSTDFLFQFLDKKPKIVKIELSVHDKINIITICNFYHNSIDGSIMLNGKSHSIGLWKWFNGRIALNFCRWTIPEIVNYYSGQTKVKFNSFGFKVIADETVVLAKIDVNGTSYLSSGFMPSNSFVIMMSLMSICFLL